MLDEAERADGTLRACYPTPMCGRYTLTIDKSTIEKRFGGRFYIAQQEFEPIHNAAPSQLLPIIRTHAPDKIELAIRSPTTARVTLSCIPANAEEPNRRLGS